MSRSVFQPMPVATTAVNKKPCTLYKTILAVDIVAVTVSVGAEPRLCLASRHCRSESCRLMCSRSSVLESIAGLAAIAKYVAHHGARSCTDIRINLTMIEHYYITL